MIDGGLARAANLGLGANEDFRGRPAEVAPDGRWFAQNYTIEAVELIDGFLEVPRQPGIGATVNRDFIDDHTASPVTGVRKPPLGIFIAGCSRVF